MPAPNPHRRAHLADTAMAVLAAQGTKGLTHRAVDTVASVPTGTTSRYFRTRDALVAGVVDRAVEQQTAALDQADTRQMSRAELVDAMVSLVREAVTVDRTRQLAMIELHLEATRRTTLTPPLAAATSSMLGALRRLVGAAGINLDNHSTLTLLSAVNGLVFTLLTNPNLPEAQHPADLARTVLDPLIPQA